MHHKIRRRPLAVVLGAVLALLPLAGFSLGLGKLKVHSALNEPLNAEIEFSSLSDSELKGLKAGLAPRSDFEAVGAERYPFLSQIKFNVVKRPDGRYVLQLKTEKPIEEPFLHMLLQVEWAGGRLVREYSALIDPPHYVAGKPRGIDTPVIPPVAIPPPTVAEAPKAEVKAAPEPKAEAKAPAEPPAAPPPPAEKRTEAPVTIPPEPQALTEELLGPAVQKPEPSLSASGWPEDDGPRVELLDAREPSASAPASDTAAVPSAAVPPSDYAVKKGDTLWVIAETARTDKQITTQQMAVAIFRANQHAFYGNNLNNLRAGKVLKIPERDSLAALPAPEARKEFRAQFDAWQEYKLKLASTSRGLSVKTPAEAPAAKEDEPSVPAAATSPASKPEPTKKPEATKPERSAPAVAKGKQTEELLKIVRSTLEAEKTTPDKKVAEAESAKDKEKKERSALADRVTTLDESLESKQLENRELGEKLGMVRSQITNESRLIELENQKLAQAQKSASESKPESAPAAPTDKKTEAPASPAAPVAPPKTEKPAAVKKPAAIPTPPPAEKDFLSTLMDDVLGTSMLPVVGGVAVLVGGVLMLIYMRRRRRSIAEFEESILSSEAISAEGPSITTDTTGQAVTTGDTSFLSEFSQGGVGHVHTDEVDPIAEAEVYLAYGRDETAEEILKEAITKNPDRHELKLKLLEIYHQRNDVAAFETLAEEFYAALGGRGGKTWEKVEEMGRKLNPDNPMFSGGAPARRATDGVTVPPAATATIAAMAATQADRPHGVAEGAPTQLLQPKSDGLDFEFALPAAEQDKQPAADDAPFTPLDTHFELPKPDSKSGADFGLEPLDLGKQDDNVIDFDLRKDTNAPGEADLSLPDVAVDDGVKWDFDASAPAAAESAQADGGTKEHAQQHWDETATKLDLAKAYIDMGDAEGARSILDEVLAEGNESQKKQAAELAAQIA